MADQSNLTISGIGADPSGSHPTGYLNKYWAETVDDLSKSYLPSSLGIMDDPGGTAAGETDTYYSKELSVVGGGVGLLLSVPATGDAQVDCTWQWYNSKDGTFADGVWTGGTWTDLWTPIHDAVKDQVSADDNAEEDSAYLSSLWRVKMVVTDAGGDAVAAGIVTAAVNAINHVSTGAYLKMPFDKQAKYNDTINNPVTVGGIGADPS